MKRWVRKAVGRRILVHTKDEQTVEGILVLQGRDGLLLNVAKLYSSDGEVPMAGDVFVPRENVALIQAP